MPTATTLIRGLLRLAAALASLARDRRLMDAAVARAVLDAKEQTDAAIARASRARAAIDPAHDRLRDDPFNRDRDPDG